MDRGPLRPERLVPILWLALSLSWAVVIVVADRPAWALAVWIASTLGPLAMLSDGSSRVSG